MESVHLAVERDLLQQMVLLRALEERMRILHDQGGMGMFPMAWGEEAISAGAISASSWEDWHFPSYRQGSIGALRGLPISSIVRQWRGDQRGHWDPRTYRIAPLCHSVASHLPHAVGFAYASRYRRQASVAIAYFGDGATSEGAFHEAMNLAGVWKAPVVFVCTNNQWAISTPVERQTAVTRLADKASAYGMPGITVDGFDALAVRAAVSQACERARTGGGPTFVEATCYRIGPHAPSDDPARYRNPDEAERYKALEPIGRLAESLAAEGIDGRGLWEQFRLMAETSIKEQLNLVETDGPVPDEMLVSTTYARVSKELDAGLARQRNDRRPRE